MQLDREWCAVAFHCMVFMKFIKTVLKITIKLNVKLARQLPKPSHLWNPVALTYFVVETSLQIKMCQKA